MGQRNHVLDGGPDSSWEGNLENQERWGAHSGATWRIPLNRPCAAAIVKLLCQLLLLLTFAHCIFFLAFFLFVVFLCIYMCVCIVLLPRVGE